MSFSPYWLQSPAARSAFNRGLLEASQLIPGYLAFGIVCGLATVQNGFNAWQSLALPALVFGGSSQIVVTQMLQGGAPLIVVIVSAVIVNLRMMVYSASFAMRLRDAPQRTRFGVSLFLVDQSFALVEARRNDPDADREWLPYYFAASLVLWVNWLLCNAVGVFVGAIVPAAWDLDFTVALAFAAILAPWLRTPIGRIGAITGAVLGVALFALPLKLGLLAAILLGVIILVIVEPWTARKSG